MWPRLPFARQWPRAARIESAAPSTLVSIIDFQCSTSSSRKPRLAPKPALARKASMRPKRSTAAATSACWSSQLVTSQRTAIAFSGPPSSSAIVSGSISRARLGCAEMARPDPTEARFPAAAPKAGHYESIYLKACHPAQPLGVWIRYTVHKRPGAEPTGSLWFTLFDAGSDGPYAVKQTWPRPAAGGGRWLSVGEAAIGPGQASGSAVAEGRQVSWELRFEAPERPLFHLPGGWMYGAPVPRTKLLSPAPAARFDGRLNAGGRDLELSGWRGMIGHNWGSQHAERWIWLHGLGFDGASDADWLDAALGRVKLGPLTTPWIANGALRLDVERDGGPALALSLTGAAAYELGMRERDHGVELQPFPDG